jgi:hypothetical protein
LKRPRTKTSERARAQGGGDTGREAFLEPRPAPRHSVASVLSLRGASPLDEGPGVGRLVDPSSLSFTSTTTCSAPTWRRVAASDCRRYRARRSSPRAGLGEAVLSSTERIDRSRKLRIYAANGVANAWLVNPVERTVEAFRPATGRGRSWRERRLRHGPLEPFEAIELALERLWGETAPGRPLARGRPRCAGAGVPRPGRPVRAEVVRLEVLRRGRSRGAWLSARWGPTRRSRAGCIIAVDPALAYNARIVDRKRAGCPGPGDLRRRFHAPEAGEPGPGETRLLYHVNNRGNLTILSRLNRGEGARLRGAGPGPFLASGGRAIAFDRWRALGGPSGRLETRHLNA